MQATPLFLGACALASIAGVVSGTAINTQPIQRGGVGMAEIARPSIDFASESTLREQVALPDHYAIDTPDGHYGVPELADRGVYSQRRYGWREAQWTPPPEPAFAGEPRSEWSERGTELAEPESTNAAVDASEQPAPPSAPDASGGEPRLIDVQAELSAG